MYNEGFLFGAQGACVDRLHELLHTVFGFKDFRPHQWEVIQAYLEDRDVLVVKPTGAGKSLCYQLPALVRDGLTVVVSPLIALMQNQVQALVEKGIPAACWNSTVPPGEKAALSEDIDLDRLKLLYVAPETLMRPGFLAWLKTIHIAGFAIDEAHCVVQWGADFRPEYLALKALKHHFPGVPTMAVTASADPGTREAIEAILLENPVRVVTGFARDNLRLSVVEKKEAKKALLAFIRSKAPESPGIVYVNSRRRAEAMGAFLKSEGFDAWVYHAGLTSEERARSLEAFLTHQAPVVVATIAFGMGIDRPDVRFVAHLDMPRCLEHYYQEIGRAGRDGQPAWAWMAVGLRDYLQALFVLEAQPPTEWLAYEKAQLVDMLAFTQSTTCRHQALMAAFGDQAAPCGHCDRCLAKGAVVDITHEATLMLSAVYRIYQKSNCAFGVEHVIHVLRGELTPKVTFHGHETLRVFGMGKDYSIAHWRRVVRTLVAQQALVVHALVEGLYLGPQATPILKEGLTVEMPRW